MSTNEPTGAPLAPNQDPKAQEKPRKTRKIKTTKDVNGVPQEIEIEVEDVDGPRWGERKDLKVLNTELRRVDGPVKVTGRARYTHDVRLPGMVYARLLCCPYPSAEVTIDVQDALKLPGVEAAIVLETKTRFLGQPIAVVAGRTSDHADDALRALKVTYKPLPWAVDRAQALAEGAPNVRKNGNKGKPGQNGDRAEAEAAIAAAPAKLEATYSVPVQHHASLETHGVVIDYRGGEEATVYISTQWTFAAVGQVAELLGLKANQVTAIVEHMGGGFGSKFDLGSEGAVACRVAKELKKPVHLMLRRPDEFVMAGNRSGNRVTYKAGMNADGTLAGLVANAEKFGGLGDGSMARPPYVYSAGKTYSEVVAVYTNTDSNRAMRAPGHPQASFGMEAVLDELAYQLGLDLLEVRKANLKDKVWHRQLERVAKEIGWFEHPHRTKPGPNSGGKELGIGFGISTWGGGGSGGTECDVQLAKDGSVTVSVGTQDLGTGSRTLVTAIVAEEFGLQLGDVVARIGNSRLPSATGSGGSTTTGSLSPAVKDAAWNARNAFAEHLAPILKTEAALVRFAGGKVFSQANPNAAMTWKQACATLRDAGLNAHGKWDKDRAAALMGNGVHGAQAAKVEVDTLTGRVRVLEMVGIQDCGLPINRTAVRSQLNGGMVQSLSYALFEERVIDPVLGLALNANFEDYKLAGPSEIPKMTSIIDDDDQRSATIGMAEPAIVPGHSAIANAVHNACGARVRDLPLTPDKVLAALGRIA
ncbi:MAG: xanthine dehydrogenase family protein molybdopterin-binding subunit [Planctomycetes bacterium]|nr:xanthine dehydrogenase family protein molybdopterin-binding subunit [Planctomycetota bacterium]